MKILVVDDERDIQTLFEQRFRKEIKEKYLKPPPVAMIITAYGDAESFDKAKQLGADDFLTKPLYFNYLKNKFKQS